MSFLQEISQPPVVVVETKEVVSEKPAEVAPPAEEEVVSAESVMINGGQFSGKNGGYSVN